MTTGVDWKNTHYARVVQYLRKAVVDFPLNGDSETRLDDWDERVVKDVEHIEDANAIGSEITSGFFKGKHALLLDLDVDHVYMPSTTPYHGHLIVDVQLDQEAMQEVLNVLSKHGILQQGFREAAAFRKATWLRTPWSKKG